MWAISTGSFTSPEPEPGRAVDQEPPPLVLIQSSLRVLRNQHQNTLCALIGPNEYTSAAQLCSDWTGDQNQSELSELKVR